MKNLTDNGTLLTLGLVGVVAAAGAIKNRGSMARTVRTAPQLADALNAHGFEFYPVDRGLLVDDAHEISIRVERGMADIEKRKLDRRGNLVGMSSVGEFPISSVSAMASAMARYK